LSIDLWNTTAYRLRVQSQEYVTVFRVTVEIK